MLPSGWDYVYDPDAQDGGWDDLLADEASVTDSDVPDDVADGASSDNDVAGWNALANIEPPRGHDDVDDANGDNDVQMGDGDNGHDGDNANDANDDSDPVVIRRRAQPIRRLLKPLRDACVGAVSSLRRLLSGDAPRPMDADMVAPRPMLEDAAVASGAEDGEVALEVVLPNRLLEDSSRVSVLRASHGDGILDTPLEIASALASEHADRGDVVNGIATKIIDDLLSHQTCAVASDTVNALRNDTDRWSLKRCRSRFACAAVLVHRLESGVMLQACIDEVKKRGGVCVLLSEHPRYDETQMVARVRDDELVYDMRSLSVVRADDVTSNALSSSSASAFVSAPQKLLQTEWRYVALFEIGDSYTSITWEIATLVQPMSAGTGEVYSRCVSLSGLDLTRFVPQFQRYQRVSATDGDGAIGRAERHLKQQRPECHVLHTKCKVHKAATMKQLVMELDPAMKDIKHMVLALRATNGLRSFRRVVRDYIVGNLEIRFGKYPLPHVLRNNSAKLDVFYPPDSSVDKMRRATLLSFANTSWEVKGTIGHDTPRVGLDMQEQEKMKLWIANRLTAALVGSGPGAFPGRNWTGAESAPSWIGVLDLVHGLLPICFLRWHASALGTKDIKGDVGKVVERGEDAAGLAVEDADEPMVAQPGGGEVVDEEQEEEVRGDVPEHEIQRKENERFRRTALSWMSSRRCVVAEMARVRLVLEPLRKYVGNLLFEAGQEWDKAEMRRAFNGLAEGSPSTPRSYRFLNSYKCTWENGLLDDAFACLFSEEFWATIPRCARTTDMEQITCRQFVRTCCKAYNLKQEHLGYPWVLFGLLDDDTGALLAQIKADKKCLRDEWSQEFVDFYGASGLGGARCIADLRATALMGREETVQIELRHAHNRRHLVARSVQVRKLDVNALNCSQILRFFKGIAKRAGCCSRSTPPSPSTSKPNSSSTSACDEPPKKKRALSAWTLFIQEVTSKRQGSPDFHALSREYHGMTIAEKQRLVAELSDLRRLDQLRTPHDHKKPSKLNRDQASRDAKLLSLGRNRASLQGRSKRPNLAIADRGSVPDASAVGADVGLEGDLAVRADSSAVDALELVPAADIDLVKRVLRHDRRQASEQDVRFEKDQSDWCNSVACADLATSVRTVMPSVVPSDVTPPLTNKFAHVSWTPTAVLQKARGVASLNSHHSGAREVLSMMDTAWQNQNLVVMGEQWESEPPQEKVTACRRAGFCVCSASTKDTEKASNNMKAVLRRVAPPKSAEAILLSDCKMVVLWFSVALPPTDGDLPGEWSSATTPTWTIIGDFGKKRSSVTYMSLETQQSLDLTIRGQSIRCGKVDLSITKEMSNQWQIWRRRDMETMWFAAFFEVNCSNHLRGSFQPYRLPCSAMCDGKLFLVWDPRVAWKVARGRRVDDGWNDLAAEDSDDDNDDEGERDEGGEDDECESEVVEDCGGDSDVDVFGSEAGDQDLAGDGLLDVPYAFERDEFDDELAPPNGTSTPVIAPSTPVPGSDLPVNAAPSTPEPPPPPPPPPHPDAAVNHDKKSFNIELPMGSLTYYYKSRTMYGYCDDPRHGGRGGCRKVRTCKSNDARPWQGRPAGFLAAWLLDHSTWSSDADHRDFCSPEYGTRFSVATL